ncbi:YdiU family protein [Conexibacter sp. W3-3-2]|uniref:protein adenylyltransferase SelO n=1 Tax=Conexibacter sp. W3-3-2 TaxID=2675227 RepID=UPI0012B80287|nr:YdiU family protein [Conexibacter sp. W3-3-2]MTD44360.1 YdiU family protein [Conexibacter sp. W3-3-2]
MAATAPPLPFADGTYVADLEGLYTPWEADAVPDARLLVLNTALAAALGLDAEALAGPDGLAALSGRALPEGLRSVAQGYAGHQFGGFSPRLGDGRAVLLGELVDPTGRRHDVHLKGSGRTPYSRGGDGKAAVGPMLREHLMGEAMHALGIPTTRALAVLATGETIAREVPLPGAVLVRIAESHLRVGTFEYVTTTLDDRDLLRRLVDHAIARHHPHAAQADNPALALLEAVADVQADLLARWQLVGFVHGVMNTDNTTISGQTIDYGPCAFMEGYDPRTVYSSIDHAGRYAYGRQPQVLQWNLARLAEGLLPLLADDPQDAVALATPVLDRFRDRFTDAWGTGMARKLGLDAVPQDGLLEDLLELLTADAPDWTGLFRDLARTARGDATAARAHVLDREAFDAWTARWLALGPDADAMDAVNPLYIPRNALVEEALAAATAGDLGPYEALLEVVTDPFVERPGRERYTRAAPPGDRHVTFCGT